MWAAGAILRQSQACTRSHTWRKPSQMSRPEPARRRLCMAALVASAGVGYPLPSTARQLDITVVQPNTRLASLPFLLARDRGWFRELAGLNIRGFIGSSGGGGATLRNALAADLPYGEVSLPAAIAALAQGVELSIVHGGVQTLADQVWVARAGAPRISVPADLVGRKIGISAAGSLGDMVSEAMIDSAGLAGKVERKVVGSGKAALSALSEGVIDIAMLAEPAPTRSRDLVRPLWSAADVFGPCMQTVGIARTDWLLKNGATMQGIIAARRRGVQLIRAEPAHAALLMSSEYGVEPAQALALVERMLRNSPLWSDGAFHEAGMQAMQKGLQRIGALPGAASDWRRAVRADYLG